MSAQPKILLSVHDYLELERSAPYKSEYFRGEVFAMAGASPVHNRIVANLNGILYNHLKGKKCKFFPSDLKVYVEKYPYYTYPDLSIVCNNPEYSALDPYTLMNPTTIIEVLSPSNAHYDKGTKFGLYRSLPSLNEFIMVSSFSHQVEIYNRIEGDIWNLTADAKNLQQKVLFKSIELEVPLLDIYDDADINEYNVIEFKR